MQGTWKNKQDRRVGWEGEMWAEKWIRSQFFEWRIYVHFVSTPRYLNVPLQLHYVPVNWVVKRKERRATNKHQRAHYSYLVRLLLYYSRVESFYVMAMNSLLLRRSLLTRIPRRSNRVQQSRSMGGGQPESQSMQARLWEGHPTQPEGWENTMYVTIAASTVLMTLALGFAPDSSIQSVSVHIRIGFF